MNRLRVIAASAVAVAGITTAAVIATSGPSYPHSWCGPVIIQLQAHQSAGQYLANLDTLQSKGAPVGQLITDQQAYLADETGENTDTSASYGDVFAATGDLDKVAADLKQINAECEQPGDAWKTDNS
jgi:hypothetical protein